MYLLNKVVKYLDLAWIRKTYSQLHNVVYLMTYSE